MHRCLSAALPQKFRKQKPGLGQLEAEAERCRSEAASVTRKCSVGCLRESNMAVSSSKRLPSFCLSFLFCSVLSFVLSVFLSFFSVLFFFFCLPFFLWGGKGLEA